MEGPIPSQPASSLKDPRRKGAQTLRPGAALDAPCRPFPVVSARNLIVGLLALAALAFPAGALAATPTGGTSPDGAGSSPSTATTGGSSTSGPSARSARVSLLRAARNLGQRTLRTGSKGRQVKVLQQVLIALGYKLRASGYFGAVTRARVRSFQRTWALPDVGYVGPATGKALRDALSGGKPPARSAQPVPQGVSVNGWTFPIRGSHSYGDDQNVYGAPRDGGRRHAGQDVMAACGTPLVAARGGQVVGADYGGSAGYFLAVHTTDTPYDYFYAHMRARALVSQGQTVRTGQLVGYVGDTGDAVGCHLHIELWNGGWWNGGSTVDPLPFLRAWDR